MADTVSPNPHPPRLIAQQTIQAYSGPTPHPDILAAYEALHPGAAGRILDLAESQSRHRMKLESRVINSDVTRANWGLACGSFITLCILACGTFLVYTGHDWAGASIVTLDVGSMIGLFVFGTKSRREEREEKARIRTSQQGKKSKR